MKMTFSFFALNLLEQLVLLVLFDQMEELDVLVLPELRSTLCGSEAGATVTAKFLEPST